MIECTSVINHSINSLPFFGFAASVFSKPFPSWITQLEFSLRGDRGLLGLHRLWSVDWALHELSCNSIIHVRIIGQNNNLGALVLKDPLEAINTR